MIGLQLFAIALALVAPLAMWAAHRRRPQPGIERAFALTIGISLLLLYCAGLLEKFVDGELDAAHALPMQLCDWTLMAVAAALFWRWQTCFEVAYFWGLCGSSQALFTPAIPNELEVLRQLTFFLDHAGIIAGILFLLLVPRMRPRSFSRAVVWSEIYLVLALIANALTGANYGFLAHKPAQASMLDLFSQTHALYIAEINIVALVFFLAAYAPWWIADRLRRTRRAGAVN
ncbi:MAG TPA: TIGR02206 family membrane protein [Chthoniobacteraceae bacterium]|nr:TIGR02206 family membrane protein [Chthoniobacteraceae bacterium]